MVLYIDNRAKNLQFLEPLVEAGDGKGVKENMAPWLFLLQVIELQWVSQERDGSLFGLSQDNEQH